MQTTGNLPDPLRSSLLFQSLSPEVVAKVRAAGKVALLPAGQKVDITAATIEFLNLILAGKMEVEKLSPEKELRKRMVGPGYTFGSIDAVLGTGRFISAKTFEECRIFTLHRHELRRLLLESPELNRHLSQLRLAIAMRLAKEYQKRLETHEALISRGSDRHTVYVAPRFPVGGELFNVTLRNGDVRRVDNVSETGLFILGKTPGKIGDEIQLTVKSKSPQEEMIELTGTITRQALDGFGIRLAHLTEPVQMAWEQLVTGFLSLRIDEVFQPKLKTLSKPEPVQITLPDRVVSGKLQGLSVEGALIQVSEPIVSRVVELMIAVPSDEEAPSALKLKGEILGKKEDTHLIRFGNLMADQVAGIHQVLAEPLEVEKPTETIEREGGGWSGKISTRSIQSQTELCRFFIQELKEQTVILQDDRAYQKGDRVTVLVNLDSSFLPVARSRSRLELRGKIVALRAGCAIMEIDRSSFPVIAELKSMADSLNRAVAAKAFMRASDDEHNVKNRRYIQVGLIVILLGACIWWAVDKVLA